MLNRDEIYKNLKSYVIEFTLKNNSIVRLSLREDVLPPEYKETKTIVEDFHKENPNKIGAWKVTNPAGWFFINIEDVIYTQIIDSY